MIRPLLAIYKKHRAQMSEGYVFPIGDEPDNMSWSAFQNVMPDKKSGYLTVFRQIENQEQTKAIALKFIAAGMKLKLTDLVAGTEQSVVVGMDNMVTFHIDNPAGFQYLKYEVE